MGNRAFVALTAHFDPTRSIVVAGPPNSSYRLKPVIHLLHTHKAATIRGGINPGTFSDSRLVVTVILELDKRKSYFKEVPTLQGVSMKRERRQCTRVLLGCSVMVKTDQGIVVGQIIDISLGGAFICCREPLAVAEVLEINFRVSPQGPHVKATGEVVRSNAHCLDGETVCHGMGVQFTELTYEGRQFIADLVENQSREQDHPQPLDHSQPI